MATRVYLDTAKLRFYQDAPDNYCHFVLGNLFEVFVGLHESGLIGEDLEIVHNNVGPHFEPLYSVFTAHPIRRATSCPAEARALSLTPSMNWSTLEASRDLSFYLPLFQQYIWSRVLPGAPAAAKRVTMIRRNVIASNRYVINEAMLARRLARECRAHGLELQVVDFQGMSFEAQVELMSGTRALVGIHGAGLVNTLFLPPSAAVVELLPHRRFEALFFRAMGLAKGNQWVRLIEPSWSAPSLYNLFLAATRPGHTKRNRFYRDRSAVFEPDSLARAFAQALAFDADGGRPVGVDVMLEPEERTFGRRVRFVASHRKLLVALGCVLIASPFLYPVGAFWFVGSALVTAAFFS